MDAVDPFEGQPMPGGNGTDGAGGQPQSPLSGELPGRQEDRHPGVERVLTLLDSVDAHADTAENALTDLRSSVTDDDRAGMQAALTEEPALENRCRSIRTDTFGSLTRSLSKLLAEEPDALPPTFDRQRANERLQSMRGAQRDLEDAIDRATSAIRSELDATESPTDGRRPGRDGRPENRRLERALDDAEQALGDLQSITSALRSTLSPSQEEMQALSMDTIEMEDGSDPQTISGGVDATVAGEDVQPGAVSEPAPAEIEMPDMAELRETTLSEIEPTHRLHDHLETVLQIPNLAEREDPVEAVMAAPTFTAYTYQLLAELDQEYFLPGAGEIPKNSMGVLQTNPTFIESFLTGMNHEMARELRWRRYPTDKRETYFRRFWDRSANPDIDTDNPEAMADIEPIHTWDQNDLGENSPGDDDAQVVLLIKGELLRRYPNTDVFAAKAVDDDGDRVPALPGTHVTREDAQSENEFEDIDHEDLKFPSFRGTLEPDITFFGFDITPDEALYEPYHRSDTLTPDNHPNEGWFFVLQEPPAETRFGLDVGEETDVLETPAGITTKEGTETAESDAGELEHGLNAVSWAHLAEEGQSPDDVTHVRVGDSRPGREEWSVDKGTTYLEGDPDHSYSDGESATWGYNSAHMARFTWQLPVRVSIHADDMITEDSAFSWREHHNYGVRYLNQGGL